MRKLKGNRKVLRIGHFSGQRRGASHKEVAVETEREKKQIGKETGREVNEERCNKMEGNERWKGVDNLPQMRPCCLLLPIL